MLLNFTTVAVPLLVSVTTPAATLPIETYNKPLDPTSIEVPYSPKKINIIDEKKTAIREVAPENLKEKRLVCKGCNTYESLTLNFLQDNGITDKNALATIMGNIQQESTFVANICEGGQKTSYKGCRRGGFGIIQWTSIDRYDGLGQYAARSGLDPSHIETQLNYMLHEYDWKLIEDKMKTPGKSINYYMGLAQRWIRWGVHGYRTEYAYAYSKKIVPENI